MFFGPWTRINANIDNIFQKNTIFAGESKNNYSSGTTSQSSNSTLCDSDGSAF